MTKAIVIVSTILIAIIDLWLALSGQETISAFLYTTSREYPVIALVAGILAGHIFWPVRVK